jgi:hypothetical protein
MANILGGLARLHQRVPFEVMLTDYVNIKVGN